MNLGKRCVAEFFGTFWLVMGGCGTAVLAAGFPQLGVGFAGVALAFGLTLLTIVLRDRPHFRLPHQSSGDLRPRGGRTVPGQRSYSIRCGAGNRRDTRRLCPVCDCIGQARF